MVIHALTQFFYIDILAKIMIALVLFIGIIVGIFAKQFMQGDNRYGQFFCLLGLVMISTVLMVSSDQLVGFLICWCISNLLLVKLMIHNPRWQAAKNAGLLAARTFFIGTVCLASAFSLLYYYTNETSIQLILRSLANHNGSITLAMFLILIAAMSQSAIWPFHRWLISSLNSPTPVSAMMHAGLVNGGGFVLARFAPLYLSTPNILSIIFLFGLCTALLGTLWKLMQSDIKKMLACSTMAQMGFMFAQCGLGLFPSAVAHLCWHGMFKANLFLSSNNAASESHMSNNTPPNIVSFVLAIGCGLLGSCLFAITSHMWTSQNTTIVLVTLCFIAGAQFSVGMLGKSPFRKLPITLLVTGLVASLYGHSVWVIERIFSPLHIMQPQPLNFVHFVGLGMLMFMWLAMLFKDQWIGRLNTTRVWLWVYVKALNDSQPDPTTVTTHRNEYRYD